jgi:Mce-associated membrane protein
MTEAPRGPDPAAPVPVGGGAPVPDPDGPRRSPAFILVTSLAVALAVAVAVLVVLLAGEDDGSDRLEAVQQAAGTFGEALVTYDYKDPGAHRDAVLELSTGSFRDEYEDAFDQGLSAVITEVKATSTGFAKDIYVSEIGESDAQAIVVLDVDVDGVAGPRTQRDLYVRLTFVEVDGEWKVDQVTDLNFDPGAATTTTTSTAPQSTTTSI